MRKENKKILSSLFLFLTADVEWRIESFKQGKKNIADSMIKFKALAMKADINELHAIFLLKKNV